MKAFYLATLIGFAPLLTSLSHATGPNWPTGQTVIEIDPVEGAESYEIEIAPKADVITNSSLFKIAGFSYEFRVRLAPGDYFVKTRTIDKKGRRSQWSTPQEFTVAFKSLKEIYPANQAVINPASAATESLTFQWPKATDASGYHFVLKDSLGKTMIDKKIKDTWLSLNLEIDSTYYWSVTPLSKDQWESPGEAAKTETPSYQFRIAGPPADSRPITISAKALPGAVKYQFEFLKLSSSGEIKSASVIEGQLSELKSRLAPGTYEVRVRSCYADQSTSDWSVPFKFFVPSLPAKTIYPEAHSAIEPTDDLNSKVQFEWQAVPDAHHYLVYVYDRDGNYLTRFESTEPKVIGTLEHAKDYQWMVLPYSFEQNQIDHPNVDQNVSSFSIKPYTPLRLAAAEEPNNIYSWARYYTSITDYVGKNYDLNSLINQKIYVNTLEAAVGFWHRQSKFGLLAHGGVSGFIVENHLHNFANAGLHLGYRYISTGGTRIRAWLGATYLEFPEFLRSPYVDSVDYKRIRSLGPQLQLSYMDELSGHPNYGYHLYAVLFQQAQSLSTPNGLPQEEHLNYTLGVFGTYRSSEQTKWQLGYAYKHESIEYKSSDRSGENNSSTFSGHYINLSLEWGFGEKMK